MVIFAFTPVRLVIVALVVVELPTIRFVIEARVEKNVLTTPLLEKKLVDVAFVSVAFVAVRLVKIAVTAFRSVATKLEKNPFVEVLLKVVKSDTEARLLVRFVIVPAAEIKLLIDPVATERLSTNAFVVVELVAVR